MRKIIATILLLAPLMMVAQKKEITLDDVYKKGTFRTDGVPGFKFMKDGKFYIEIDQAKNIMMKKDLITGNVMSEVVIGENLKTDEGKKLDLNDFEFSMDETKLLFFLNREKIYRRSSKAIVYALDIATGKLTKIDNEKVLHATYSPDGSKVAFVKGNNIYYKELSNNITSQITKDGEWNKIINGNCDWVYEEEFGFTKAFQWSPDSRNIAYYRFDESKVKEYNMTMFSGLYPEDYRYKYPKAGEGNSKIEIHIYNLGNGSDLKADIGAETDIYIPRIKWTANANTLCITHLNRLQNHVKLLLADAATGNTSTLYEETNKYFVDIDDNIYFTKDGKGFVFASEKDGYQHLYYNSIDGKTSIQLTKGKFETDNFIGVDEKTKMVYFTAAYYSPMDRQLFSVDITGKNFKQISKGVGWHAITMNPDFSYYIDYHSDINTPQVISIKNIKGETVKELRDNAKLRETMSNFDLGKIEFIKVPNRHGDSLNGWMLKPANFDPAKKYPVLFCNYGGPGSQQVVNRFGAVNFWHQMLAQKGYIILSVDNTGTGFRGEEFKKKTYKQLGKFEIEDQIDAAKYLTYLPFIDGKRIGHWGWSYGGFMSSLAITKGADVFSYAIAVAPVTSWRFYDNIYTERYMRTPQENPDGYDNNSPINFVEKIKGKYLILHGTGDDNVHFQNSVMMVDAMINKNVEFESGYYPNKDHGIRGGNTSYHIYKKMTDFVLSN